LWMDKVWRGSTTTLGNYFKIKPGSTEDIWVNYLRNGTNNQFQKVSDMWTSGSNYIVMQVSLEPVPPGWSAGARGFGEGGESDWRKYFPKLMKARQTGMPNTSAQDQSVLDLNPVIELTLPMDESGLTDMFDPETGKIIPSPNPYSAPNGSTRSSKKGLLIKSDPDASRIELVGMNGVMTQESRADQWDEITNLEALETLRRNYMNQGGSVGALVSGKGPHTFLFKTGSDRIGILQITGFTDNPRGVKIRYKLVRPQTSAAMIEAARDNATTATNPGDWIQEPNSGNGAASQHET
ncbi:MAG: hypothetical protein ACTHKU_10380, partial [Verrucomicrobiota bacterium]